MRDEEGPSGFGQVSLIGIVSFGPRLVSNIYSIFKNLLKLSDHKLVKKYFQKILNVNLT